MPRQAKAMHFVVAQMQVSGIPVFDVLEDLQCLKVAGSCRTSFKDIANQLHFLEAEIEYVEKETQSCQLDALAGDGCPDSNARPHSPAAYLYNLKTIGSNALCEVQELRALYEKAHLHFIWMAEYFCEAVDKVS